MNSTTTQMTTTQSYQHSPLLMARPRLRIAFLSLKAKLVVADLILVAFVLTCAAYA